MRVHFQVYRSLERVILAQGQSAGGGGRCQFHGSELVIVMLEGSPDLRTQPPSHVGPAGARSRGSKPEAQLS